jgi:hypothetical protein
MQMKANGMSRSVGRRHPHERGVGVEDDGPAAGLLDDGHEAVFEEELEELERTTHRPRPLRAGLVERLVLSLSIAKLVSVSTPEQARKAFIAAQDELHRFCQTENLVLGTGTGSLSCEQALASRHRDALPQVGAT